MKTYSRVTAPTGTRSLVPLFGDNFEPARAMEFTGLGRCLVPVGDAK